MPAVIFPSAAQNPTAQGVISLGKVWIGQINTDPRTLANRIDVTIIQQDGTPVVIPPASQPFVLNAGGIFTYAGSVVLLNTEQPYALALDTAQDVQVYYLPNSAAGDNVATNNLILTPLATAPDLIGTAGQLFTLTVEGVVEAFYEDSEGHIIQLTNNGSLNVDLGTSTVTAAILDAIFQVTGTQFRGDPIVLTVNGDGDVECDVSLGMNYSLILNQNVGTFFFINAPSGKVPNICVSITNTGMYTIGIFDPGPGVIKIPDAVSDLFPSFNATTDYGVAVFSGPEYHVYPVLMKTI